MSNVKTSTTTPKVSPNTDVQAVAPAFLTALQDIASFYGYTISGKYIKPNGPHEGAAKSGTFYLEP